MLRSTQEKLRATGGIVLVWLLISVAGLTFLWFPQMHFRLMDMLHGSTALPETNITIVGIDAKSLRAREEGGLGRWQDWPRTHYASVIDRLRGAGAKVIGVDVFFSEPSSEGREAIMREFVESNLPVTNTLPSEATSLLQASINDIAQRDDAALASAIAQKSDVILAASALGARDLLLPAKQIAGSGTRLGSVTLLEDSDNILRRVPIFTGNPVVPQSFAFALFLAWTGAEEGDFFRNGNHLVYQGPQLRSESTLQTLPLWNFPVDEHNQIIPQFHGGPQKGFPLLSFADVYTGNFDQELVRGKVILIGEVDAGLHDDLYTPVSYGEKMSGVEVHAHTLQSLINNTTLENSPLWMHISIFLGLAITLCIIGLFLGPIWGAILLFVLGAASLVLSIYAYSTLQILISTWYLFLPLVGVYASILVYKIFFEQKEKKQAMKAFSHYVSDKVAHMMIQNPSLLKLGGEKKVLSVSFTDIAGFTTLSEHLTPEQITDFLHVYLEKMTQVVLNEDGTLDKYIGDAIMSIYGAPVYQPDHAVRACRTVLEMHAMIPAVVQALPMNLPADMPLCIRSGIATGEMVVGNFGSHKRFDYTVIGDRVNLSSRLEGANKEYGSEICVNEETYEAAKHVYTFRTLDSIRVKGKKEPVRIYELIGENGKVGADTLNMIEDFEHAFILYQQKSFETARERFREIFQTFGDIPSEKYMHRCAYFVEHPPEGSWDGSFTMTSK